MIVYILIRPGPDGIGSPSVYGTRQEAMAAAEAEAPNWLTRPPGHRVYWTAGGCLIHRTGPDDEGRVLFVLFERRILGVMPPVWAVECDEHWGGPDGNRWVDGLYATKTAAETRAARMGAERGDDPPYLHVRVREYQLRGA